MSVPVARVALDLLGGGNPTSIAVGARAALDADPALHVIVVGPVDVASSLFAATVEFDRCSFVEASGVVGDDGDALRAIRGRRDATPRVAARLVRDGGADAFVSAGPPAITQAAASFGLGLLSGTTHPSLAVTLGRSTARDCVLVDVGASPDFDAAQLVQHAVHGAAYATATTGVAVPRIALLAATSTRDGLGLARRRAYTAFESGAELGFDFAGVITVPELLRVGEMAKGADVVVTDGFTGGVLRAALEGHPGAEPIGRPILLGFRGPAVLAVPAEDAVRDALVLAAAAHRADLAGVTRVALARLVGHRRAAAGLATRSIQ